MPEYLHRQSQLACAHGGIVQPGGPFSQSLVIDGQPALMAADIESATIVGCTWVGVGKVPCTGIASILAGKARNITVDGSLSMLDTWRASTNGNGPGFCSVRSTQGGMATRVPRMGTTPAEPPETTGWTVADLAWSSDEARTGERVHLTAATSGLNDDTPVEAMIFEHDEDSAPDYVRTLDGVVRDGSIDLEWDYEYHKDVDDLRTHPEYFFVLNVWGRRFGDECESGLLRFQDWIEVTLAEEQTGSPHAGVDLILTASDGNEHKKTTDENGRVRFDGIPPGRCSLRIGRS